MGVIDIISNISFNAGDLDRRPADCAERQQRLRDCFDALDEACLSLRIAIEALESCEAPPEALARPDDIEAMQDIAAGLTRDREALRAQLVDLDASDEAALAREYARESL